MTYNPNSFINYLSSFADIMSEISPLWLDYLTKVEDTFLSTNTNFWEFLYKRNYKYFLSTGLLDTLLTQKCLKKNFNIT